MEQSELTEENLQNVTGGMDKGYKTSLSVGAGVVGTALVVGSGVVIAANRNVGKAARGAGTVAKFTASASHSVGSLSQSVGSVSPKSVRSEILQPKLQNQAALRRSNSI